MVPSGQARECYRYLIIITEQKNCTTSEKEKSIVNLYPVSVNSISLKSAISHPYGDDNGEAVKRVDR